MKLRNIKQTSSFGLDIGNNNVKVVQIVNKKTRRRVSGYGYNEFKASAIKDGEIINFEELEKCIKELFNEKIYGVIDGKSVVLSIPSTYVYTRAVTMPKVSKKNLEETVILEAEQYIPTSISQLYIDHEIIAESDKQMEVLVVAAPKRIIDSYVELFSRLKINISSIESSMDATIRVLRNSDIEPGPALVIDFGSIKSNLAVLDNTVRVTGYTSYGGVHVSKLIGEALKLTPKKAEKLKVTEGLFKGKNRSKIEKAIAPVLSNLSQEIRRMITYYDKRHANSGGVNNIILVGGSSKMPGLNEYIEKKLKMPVLLCDPWRFLDFNKIKPPKSESNGVYTTAVGLALANYEKAYRIRNEIGIDEDVLEQELESQLEETAPAVHTETEEVVEEDDSLLGNTLETEENIAQEEQVLAENSNELDEDTSHDEHIDSISIQPAKVDDSTKIKTGKSRFK